MTKFVNNYNSPNSTELLKLELVRYNQNWGEIKRQKIATQVAAFSIYEDILKPTLYAEFHFRDAIDILQNFPILGDEVIEVEFRTSATGVAESSKYAFSIVEVVDPKFEPLSHMQSYTVRCVTHEHLVNTQRNVAKSYGPDSGLSQNDKSYIHFYVQDILNSYLDADNKQRPEKKSYTFEPCKDMISVTIPRLQPFEAIDFLRYRAVSKQNPNSLYLFYENKNGFNFVTIDGLVKWNRGGKLKEYTLGNVMSATTLQNDGSEVNYEDKQSHNIEAFKMVGRQNTFQKLAGGAIKNVVKSLDLTSKAFTVKAFETTKQNHPQTTDESSQSTLTNTLTSKFNKTGLQLFSATTNVQGSSVVDAMGVKQAHAALFNETTARILIPGDNTLTVGQIIKINVPEVEAVTKKREEAKLVTGNYLITKIRHVIAGDEHKISAEVTKIGYIA